MASKNGKVIMITSVKGGVGKTITTLNLAGIYHTMNLKTLVIDMDLYAGGIAAITNVGNDKDSYILIDALTNNRFTTLSNYVSKYNENIDVLCCPRDPRSASKIDGRYIKTILDFAKKDYDIILVDSNHILSEINLILLDNSYMSLFVITNDPVDLKNMRSLVTIFKDLNKKNYLTVLNNSRDTGKDYLSLFDIRNITKTNIDYVIPKSFYIKNIDKYTLKGEILTLNPSIIRTNSNDLQIIKKMALDLIDVSHKEGEKNG